MVIALLLTSFLAVVLLAYGLLMFLSRGFKSYEEWRRDLVRRFGLAKNP